MGLLVAAKKVAIPLLNRFDENFRSMDDTETRRSAERGLKHFLDTNPGEHTEEYIVKIMQYIDGFSSKSDAFL